MKFIHNNIEYYVKWDYDKTQTCTFCLIYDNSTSFSEPLVREVACKSEKDRFEKNIGRKISLGRALHKLFPGGTKEDVKGRSIAWFAYFNESPKRIGKQCFTMKDLHKAWNEGFLEGELSAPILKSINLQQ